MTDAELVEAACEVMHDAYEAAAVGAGWETNPRSRLPWALVPEANKTAMRAAVRALFNRPAPAPAPADAELVALLLTEARAWRAFDHLAWIRAKRELQAAVRERLDAEGHS